MLKKFRQTAILLTVLYLFYGVVSYLIFLRDDFLLERIAFLTDAPWLLEWGRPWGRRLHVNSIPTVLYAGIITCLFLLYLRALDLVKGVEKAQEHQLKRTFMMFTLLYIGIVALSFPSLSTDVFDYIATNRVLFVHKQNPWLHPPQEFVSDEFMYLGSWKFRASVYGPVQFVFSSVVHFLGQDSLIKNIIAFKLESAAFYLATLFLLNRFLRAISQERLVSGLLFLAWNPLVLIEVIGNAHNDMIMAFFTLLAAFWYLAGKTGSSALALSLAVLAKTTSAVYVPIMVYHSLRKGRSKEGIGFLAIFALATLLGLLTLGQGALGLIRNMGVQLGLYLRSLPTLVRFLFINFGMTETRASMSEKLITLPLFATSTIAILKSQSNKNLLSLMVSVMILYLLIAAPMLQPWYLIWFLPLAVLVKDERLQAVAIAFSWSTMMYYAVLFTSFYLFPLHFGWQIVMFLVQGLPPLFLWFMPEKWYTRLRIALHKVHT